MGVELGRVRAAEVETGRGNVCWLTFEGGVRGRVAWLDEGVVRVTVDPTGEFPEYAPPLEPAHVARIPVRPDGSPAYAHPAAALALEDGVVRIEAGAVCLRFDERGRMALSVGGACVMREAAPLAFDTVDDEPRAVQALLAGKDELFFGGGTQNGRWQHAGRGVNIAPERRWDAGDVASPCPFYWSSAGYSVLRNTFGRGFYDFGEKTAGVVEAWHNDVRYDAYVFVAAEALAAGHGSAAAGNHATSFSPAPRLRSVAQGLLARYYKVTGAPALLPEYAFYLGHLNAYNRDAWSRDGAAYTHTAADGSVETLEPKAWVVKGEAAADASRGDPGVSVAFEYGRNKHYVLQPGETSESLNGRGPAVAAQNTRGVRYDPAFSARAVVERYARFDMPLGWILPNDGYGAGYGQNGYLVTGGVDADGTSSPERLAAVAANVDNLADFSRWAAERGVSTGLWTESQLTVDSDPNTYWHRLRDFAAEVGVAGVTTLKTDEEWVGQGYSMALDAQRQAYTTCARLAGVRPNVVTLCGWAGTQRFGAVWSGDQVGDDWEYIRMHVPTYVGQGLSGNPNAGSDMDGIWGGNPLVAARDYQWKAFSALMLDMDGWGTYPKAPFAYGEPFTGVARRYLKLKARLMPYTYTCAAAASGLAEGNGDKFLPLMRSVLLGESAAAGADEGAEPAGLARLAASENLSYEYLYGPSFLVAPVWRNTRADAQGNDVRDGIYLPGCSDDVWIDYFSGRRYSGGQTLDGFDAPLWKLPLFVRANAVIPQYEEHNNPRPRTATNPRGLDRTRRVVEFFAVEGAPGCGAAGSGPALGPGTGRFVLFEDDGTGVRYVADASDASYGVQDLVDYGPHVETVFSLNAAHGTAEFVAEASRGSYAGYDPFRVTTFAIHAAAEPQLVEAFCGDEPQELTWAASREAFDADDPDAGTARAFWDGERTLWVRFSRQDVSTCSQRAVVRDFVG